MMADGQALRITRRLFTAMFELVDLICWESEGLSTSVSVLILIWMLSQRLSRVALVCDVLL